jgi:hypothetical protein
MQELPSGAEAPIQYVAGSARLKPCPCMLPNRDANMDTRFGGKADCPLGHRLLSLFER